MKSKTICLTPDHSKVLLTLTFNRERDVKSACVYMENGFDDWNLCAKFQFQMEDDVNIIAVVFFSAHSALTNTLKVPMKRNFRCSDYCFIRKNSRNDRLSD